MRTFSIRSLFALTLVTAIGLMIYTVPIVFAFPVEVGPGGELGGSLYVERELRFVEPYPSRDFDYEKMTVTKRLTLWEYAWLREKYFLHPTPAWQRELRNRRKSKPPKQESKDAEWSEQ